MSQLILETCSYIVFIRSVDVMCRNCQKIAFWAILGVKNGVLGFQGVTIVIFLYEDNTKVSQLILQTCLYIVFTSLVDVLCRYYQKIAFWAILGVKNGVLGFQGVTIFIFLYEDNTKVSQWILQTCSYIVFTRLVDVMCRYYQKIAFWAILGVENGV